METEIEILKHENAELKAKIAELEAKIKIFKIDEDVCPYCRQPKGKFLNKGPSVAFRQFGLIRNFYKCENYGKEYEKQN